MYVDSVDRSHRDRHGQFFTPPRLADFMVRWLLKTGASTLFDPAVGLGAFQVAARRSFPWVGLVGCEKDFAIRTHFERENPGLKFTFCGSEYFSSTVAEQAAIVCNPPYMRFQNFDDKEIASAVLEQSYSERFSGFMNASSAFLLRSISHLRDDGRLAYLMPLEFLAAGYGEAVKRILLESTSDLTFIRFVNEAEIFPEVLTSVGLVLLRKGRPGNSVRFVEVEGLRDLEQDADALKARHVPRSVLDPSKKWYSYFSVSQQASIGTTPNSVALAEFGRFSRGIATGANGFFVVRPSEFRRLELPDAVARICLSKSQQVRKRVFSTRDMDALIQADEPVMLLDLEASTVESVQGRIREGELLGVDQRYLTRQRKPWYKLEVREPPAMLFGVFSRGGAKCVLNTSSALNLTPFHGFRPTALGESFVVSLWLFLNSRFGAAALLEERRIYGGRLDKFEPNDLNKVRVPSPSVFRKVPRKLTQAAAASLEFNGTISSAEEKALTRYWLDEEGA